MNSDPRSSVVIYRLDRKQGLPTRQMTSLCIPALEIHNLAELQIVHGNRNCNFKVLKKSGIPICIFSFKLLASVLLYENHKTPCLVFLTVIFIIRKIFILNSSPQVNLHL